MLQNSFYHGDINTNIILTYILNLINLIYLTYTNNLILNVILIIRYKGAHVGRRQKWGNQWFPDAEGRGQQ